MQAVPVIEPVVASSFPNLVPGPFILLLALPAIPLLLFSVGARPPDTSKLPFSTDDLWQTTAAITVASAVVLCIGFWPGAFSGVGNWVTSGVVQGDGWVQWVSRTGSGSKSQTVPDGMRYPPRDDRVPTGQQAMGRQYLQNPNAQQQHILEHGMADGHGGWPPKLGGVDPQLDSQGRTLAPSYYRSRIVPPQVIGTLAFHLLFSLT